MYKLEIEFRKRPWHKMKQKQLFITVINQVDLVVEQKKKKDSLISPNIDRKDACLKIIALSIIININSKQNVQEKVYFSSPSKCHQEPCNSTAKMPLKSM